MVSALVVGTNTYVTEAEADTYLDDQIHSATLWAAVSSDNKKRSLIAAFNNLELLGLVDSSGVAIVASSAPTSVKNAQMELAFLFSQDPTLVNGEGFEGADNLKAAGAGSAKVEYFRPISAKRLPAIIRRLLAGNFPAGSGIGGSCASGTDVTPFFDSDDEFLLNSGYM